MYIYLFLEKNNNQIKLKHDFNDGPMNESPPINDETAWDDENEVHDSNDSSAISVMHHIFHPMQFQHFLEVMHSLDHRYNHDSNKYFYYYFLIITFKYKQFLFLCIFI